MSYTIKDVLNLFPETTAKDWNQHKNGGGWVKTSAHADESAYGRRALGAPAAPAIPTLCS